MDRVLLAMSGGIDSSVSLHLLQKSGYDVMGVFMKLHDKDTQGYENAQKVASFFGIKLHLVDFTQEFDREVYRYFIESYKEGFTPNPCVVCNKTIKFGALLDFAHSLGIQKIATGHYVQSDGEFFYEGVDASKDQSYFLSCVDKSVVAHTLFPLGGMYKEDVKQMGKAFSVLDPIAKQKESSEICFVDTDYTDILKQHMDIDLEGQVLDQKANIVGKHKGYMHYTIGKRRGFSVHGAHDPHYVTAIDAKNNRITVGLKKHLQTFSVEVEKLNLFAPLPLECEVKLRYRTKKLPCSVSVTNDRASIRLKEPAFGVARGQIAAFYSGSKLLGGGVITT